MDPRSYFFRFIIGVGALLALVATTNRIIDPFNLYQDFEIPGFNVIKTKAARFERHIKPQVLARKKPEAIILGSSYSEIGLNPLNSAFTQQNNLRGYNYAFAGSTHEDVQCQLKYALEKAPVTRVVLGLHPGPFPLADCENRYPEIENFSEAKLLLSFRSLKASVSTMRNQDKEANQSREGMYYYRRGRPGTAARFQKSLKAKLSEHKCNPDSLIKNQADFMEMRLTVPKPNNRLDLSGLKEIIRIAKKNDIALRIYAYPPHAHWLETDIMCGIYIEEWSALNAVTRLVEEEKSDAQVWEFFGYNRYTTEPVSVAEPEFWQDPRHFNFEFGEELLYAMFGDNPSPEYGHKISSADIDAVYQEFKHERHAYLSAHPEFLLELGKLLNSR